MPILTRLKRFTESATATRKTNPAEPNRWFRIADSSRRAEFDHILDLYWGGPERRITGITLRIIAVNTVALIILMLGILYMGQYQSSIITARLETFEGELDLISTALAQAADEQTLASTSQREKLHPLVRQFGLISGERISVFDKNGTRVIDSYTLLGARPEDLMHNLRRTKDGYYSLQVLKDMAGFILTFMPDRQILPAYPQTQSSMAQDFPDARDAFKGDVSLSVWQGKDTKIFITGGAPLYKNGKIFGAVLLERPGTDIENDIGEVWLNVLGVFTLTLIFTVVLSIYLSGAIARPLKKLAQAAEAVRKGKARAEDLPDFSNRHDEIGELSLALRQMTQALWQRMDSIEQFAADVAHEIKNPLTSLRSAVETAMLVKKAEDRNTLLEVIKHDVDRLDRLISDISSASRLDAELSREQLETVDLHLLFSHLLGLYQNPLERQEQKTEQWSQSVQKDGVRISMACATTGKVMVRGIEQRLGQVFQNLISNALSFSPQNGVISIYVIPLKRKVSITIEDEGPGIPDTKLETIFERFYSERPRHEDFGRHSGLGLSICKQIIEAHGGRIFAENIRSERGDILGARFTVILNKA